MTRQSKRGQKTVTPVTNT